ncbi:DUF3786 domain-containing protein [Chloroflexota bacterium]
MEEGKLFTLTGRKNYDCAHELAYKLAGEQLAKIDDIERQCLKSGAQYRVTDSQKEIVIHYLDKPYRIALPNAEVSLVDSTEQVPIRDKLLILHYFISAKGTPLANKLITFRELPEGVVYFPTFSKRTVKPLLAHFDKEPQLLLEAAKNLGGCKADYGDTAVTISAFSRVPINIILWRGDEELPPQGNVAFDATIPDYLPTEDITVLCETITWRLIRNT